MKLKIREKLQKLGNDMFITDYAGDIAQLLANKPKQYRFLYDAQADLYMICDAWDYIHMDMMEQAFKSGWYADQDEFIKKLLDMDRYNGLNYWDEVYDNYIPVDEFDDEFLSMLSDNVDRDDENIYSWIYCFGFLPNSSDYEEDEQTLINDGYDHNYKFSFGHVFTRGFDLDEVDELKTALNRLDK
jgi:hypothetical protein